MERDAAAPPLTPPATTSPTKRQPPHASVSTPVPQHLPLRTSTAKAIKPPTFGRSPQSTFDPLLPIARVPGCRNPRQKPPREWRVPAPARLSCEKCVPSSPPPPRNVPLEV